MTRDMMDIALCIGVTVVMGLLAHAYEFVFGDE
jgi:hypothetical protein